MYFWHSEIVYGEEDYLQTIDIDVNIENEWPDPEPVGKPQKIEDSTDVYAQKARVVLINHPSLYEIEIGESSVWF